MTVTQQPPRQASLIASVVKVLALGVALLVLVSAVTNRTPSRTHDPSALEVELGAADLQAAMAEYECTTTGFGDAATPLSALIRLEGRLQHVSFDHAWSVFTGEQPGELLAVCLSEV